MRVLNDSSIGEKRQKREMGSKQSSAIPSITVGDRSRPGTGVPSLVDEAGFFYNSERIPEFPAKYKQIDYVG
jgi:hypothetical protein